ncbi:MAG: AmmeMemoRadiSam system protein B, partial [Candidatus Cloacimonadaceae bacterium]|nr:AmmeMemoRadiSam system protein B [Candidatus Cloacimonadaceae bacterium]
KLAMIISDVMAKSSKRIMVIVSTDLSHYRSGDKAELLDAKFVHLVKEINPDALWQGIEAGYCEACGFGGVLTLLYMAVQIPGVKSRILHYTHSGKTTGSNDQVVGYLSASLGL